MNEREYQRAWIVLSLLVAVPTAILALVPGIDAVGHKLMGAASALFALKAGWHYRAMRRARPGDLVISPLTVQLAPAEEGVRYFLRGRWIACGAMLVVTLGDGWSMFSLDRGDIEHPHLTAPFHLLYGWFGSGVTITVMLACVPVIFWWLTDVARTLHRKHVEESGR